MIKSRRILKLINCFILIVILTSCSNMNTSSSKSKKLTGKLTILTDKRYEPILKLAANNFEKENKKVNIEIKTDDNLYNDLESNIKAKDKSIDIVSVEDPYIKYYISKYMNSFLNVSSDISYYSSNIIKHQLNNVTIKNKVYGFPWSTSPRVIIYRKDIFKRENINVDDIKTWDDYIVLGQKVTYDTGKQFLTNVKDIDNNMYLVFANQLGTSYFNSDDKLDLDSSISIKAADMLKKLYSENILFDLKSRKESVQSILNGNSVSMIADSQYISYIERNFPGYKGKLGIMKLPAFEPGGNRDVSVGGSNLLINNLGKNVDLAKEFCEFCISDDHTIIDSMKNYGYFPVFFRDYNLVEFNKNDSYFNQNIWQILGRTEKGSFPINYTQNFINIRQECSEALSSDNLKDKQAKDILDSLKKSLEEGKTIENR